MYCYLCYPGPKKSTITDTWRMLWELNANRMIMVTNLVEGGKVIHNYSDQCDEIHIF